MFIDQFVEELHKIREAYAKNFDFDVDAMFKNIKKEEQRHKDRMVSGEKRKMKDAAKYRYGSIRREGYKVNIRFFIDPETNEPHIFNHGVSL
ncbi:MAG: hypothetical protein WA705_14615 [Candidatus Ozemobacteraceae bacterium]